MQGIQKDKNAPRNLETISHKHLQYTLALMFTPKLLKLRKKGCFHCLRGIENLSPPFSFPVNTWPVRTMFSLASNKMMASFVREKSYREEVPQVQALL